MCCTVILENNGTSRINFVEANERRSLHITVNPKVASGYNVARNTKRNSTPAYVGNSNRSGRTTIRPDGDTSGLLEPFRKGRQRDSDGITSHPANPTGGAPGEQYKI
jgi:hypothetical protein